MSATQRGADRIDSDNYPTPPWCVRRLLEADALPADTQDTRHLWLEPCAGEGAIVRVLREANVLVTACELRAECAAELDALCDGYAYAPCDYLGTAFQGVDVIITNPPYAIAEAVILKALTEAPWVAVLVRQGFVGHERAAWMRSNMPDSYDLPERPSFAASVKCVGRGEATPCGWGVMQPLTSVRQRECPACGGKVKRTTSDAADYCWLVWTPERDRTAGRRVILPSTPIAERRTVAVTP